MEQEKDIRISEKKVDESWKDQIERDRLKFSASSAPVSTPAPEKAVPRAPAAAPAPVTVPEFLNLINTLAYQALYHLGEIPEAASEEVNLEAAREAIEILRALQSKTQGNLSQQESTILNTVLPELQMKFAQHA